MSTCYQGSNKLTVTFFDPQTGERDSDVTKFPDAHIRQKVHTAMTTAMKSTEIDYYGIFKPHVHDEKKVFYFELIGGHCHRCFGWIVEGGEYLLSNLVFFTFLIYALVVYRDPKTGWTHGKSRTMYYTGISAGLPSPNQFKSARECVGVSPPYVLEDKPGARDWNVFREAAQLLFMELTGMPLAPEVPLTFFMVVSL